MVPDFFLNFNHFFKYCNICVNFHESNVNLRTFRFNYIFQNIQFFVKTFYGDRNFFQKFSSEQKKRFFFI